MNLSRVFFIVTANTASASELLINNLRPYLDVKLVGPTATDGKPVGFFPVPVGDWYVFPVSFRSTNASGTGNYFNGFTPNSIVGDGLDKDWGNTSESCLASAIKYITTGAFRTAGQAQDYVPDPVISAGNSTLDVRNFKGMVGAKRPIR